MISLTKDVVLINFVFIALTWNIVSVYSLSNTANEIPDTFANLTAGNDLWTSLLRDCKKPTLSCIRDNIYKYLKHTLEYPNDVQFTSFLKFSKNSIDYGELKKTFVETVNETDDEAHFKDETPVEEMSRSLSDNTMKFFMTHDMEVQLPETFFLGTTLKMSPRSLEDNGALVKLELLPKTVENSVGEGRIFFKRIRKFVSEKLIYALLAILLVIKLLAVKLLFVLPAVVGVAAAKKLLLKVLLFLFPALHHLFKLCAYVPHGAKHHIHKHQISHIHEIGHGHHHHGPPHHKHHGHIEVYSPHKEGPPSLHHYSDIHKDHFDPHEEYDTVYPGGSFYGDEVISHRNDPTQEENEIDSWGHGQHKKPGKLVKSGRPLTPSEIENMILKAEKEALIKARLEKEKQRIHEENLRLQDQLNKALIAQENLKQQAAVILHSKKPQPSRNYNIVPPPNRFVQTSFAEPPVAPNPVGVNSLHPRIDQPYPMQIPQKVTQNREPYLIQPQSQLLPPQNSQKRAENVKIMESVQANVKHYENPKVAESRQPNVKQDIYKAASITYDPFYSPILENIDKILRGLGFNEEPCRERLICSMYKNPSNFSPHSNLLSVELSRDTKDLQKPTSTNAAVIRFYRYVQAARDGQDKRDCVRLYPACDINTEL